MQENNPVMIKLDQRLTTAQFIDRPNRFLIRCQLQEDQNHEKHSFHVDASGQVVEAHLPDPGRMKELLVPGNVIWLKPAIKPGRKTQWTAVLTKAPESGELVSIDSTLPNDLIEQALAASLLDELDGWTLVRREVTVGGSRFDYLLTSADGRQMALEVKSVTLVKEKTGLFPDAVTARGTRHVRELTDLCRQEGWEAGILFVGQRQDMERIRAAAEIDPAFAQALKEAHQAGVRIMARRCRITPEAVILDKAIPVEV
jgi:sugar fermentation stimulation protein A